MRSKALVGILLLVGVSVILAKVFPRPSPSDPEERVDAVELETVRKLFNRQNPGYGTTDYPGHSADHIPKSYAMILMAEIQRHSESSAPLPEAADMIEVSGRWLLNHSDENRNGVIGWGVPIAWDAYGDGSVNAGHTEYSISTAIVIEALLDWYAQENAPKEKILKTVRAAVAPYLSSKMRTPSGLVPYSLQRSDRKYDTFNPAAYFAGQIQRLSFFVDNDVERKALREAANLTMASLLANKKVSPERGYWYWDYSIQENNPNDLPHASYIIEGIRTYKQWHGDLGNEFPLDKIIPHLSEFFDAKVGVRSWPSFKTAIESPARSYDLGMALHVSCTSELLKKESQSFLKARDKYRTAEGRISRYPVDFEKPLIVNEYEAYLYRGLTTCYHAQFRERQKTVSKVEPSLREHVRELVGTPTKLNAPLKPALVSLRKDLNFQFHPELWKSSIQLGRRVYFPQQGIPLRQFELGLGVTGFVFKTFPENKLLIHAFSRGGDLLWTHELLHDLQSQPILRGLIVRSSELYVVYYDNPSSSNYVSIFSVERSGLKAMGAPLRLPSLMDPAGLTYEMIPAVFLFSTQEGVQFFGGNLSGTVRNGEFVNQVRLPECVRVVEAQMVKGKPQALCLVDGPSGVGFVRLDNQGVPIENYDLSKGIPWKLDGQTTSRAAAATDYAALYRYDLERGANSGWLEFGENNTEGRVAWSQIYYLNGFLDTIYLAERDPIFFEVVRSVLPELRQRLDLEISILNRYWADGHFKTRAFTVDRSPAYFAVQTSRLLLLMDRYLNEIPNPVPLDSFESLKAKVKSLEGHIEVLSTSGEASSWIDRGKAHLRWPKGSKFSFDGLAVPFNHQNEWAYATRRVLTLPDGDVTSVAGRDIIEFFLRRIAQDKHLPRDGVWDYWWGRAFDGWEQGSGVSVNRPSYPGDKIKAWISFRSIDVMATLANLDVLDKKLCRSCIFDSAVELVGRGHLYPFVSYELARRGKLPELDRPVSHRYLRVSSQWEHQSSPWAYRAAVHEISK